MPHSPPSSPVTRGAPPVIGDSAPVPALLGSFAATGTASLLPVAVAWLGSLAGGSEVHPLATAPTVTAIPRICQVRFIVASCPACPDSYGPQGRSICRDPREIRGRGYRK